MLALKVPKAPWAMPKKSAPLKPEASTGNLTQKKFQVKLEETVRGVQDFIKKHWLYD